MVLSSLLKVMLYQYTGEVGNFITFWYQVSQGCSVPKIIIEIGRDQVIQKNKKGDTVYIYILNH